MTFTQLKNVFYNFLPNLQKSDYNAGSKDFQYYADKLWKHLVSTFERKNDISECEFV